MISTIFHADLDAFYASVEQLDNPSLKGLPVVVGARPGQRGVVAACSYEARAFGIHSALPINQAYKLCPQAQFRPVRMKRYQEISAVVMGIFRDFAPEVRQISVDEAFLDLSGTEAVYGQPLVAGAELKRLVRERTGLALSIGIGTNRYIAKLASARSKPDGLFFVEPGNETAFLETIPLFKLWGIGDKTAERLKARGFSTVTSLRAVSLAGLKSMFGEASAAFLYNIVRGIDPGIFSDQPKSHSLSGERTYETDISQESILEATLLELAEELRFRLMAEGVHSRTLQLKLRYDDFQTLTIRETSGQDFESIEEIYASARRLLHRKWQTNRAVRLIGLALINVSKTASTSQADFFKTDDDRRQRVEKTILELKRNRGLKLTKARLLDRQAADEPTQGECPEDLILL